MNSKIFHEAIKATARIACYGAFIGVVACETKTESPPNDTGDDTAASVNTENQTSEPDSQPGEMTFDSCMTQIEEGYSNPNTDTTHLVDCCILTTEEVGYTDLHDNPEYTDLQENCCDEIAQASINGNTAAFSSACTPWGPPTPPAMCAKEGVTHA